MSRFFSVGIFDAKISKCFKTFGDQGTSFDADNVSFLFCNNLGFVWSWVGGCVEIVVGLWTGSALEGGKGYRPEQGGSSPVQQSISNQSRTEPPIFLSPLSLLGVGLLTVNEQLVVKRLKLRISKSISAFSLVTLPSLN